MIVVDDGDALSVRRYLTGELIALGGLTDLTLTSARLEAYDEDGEASSSARCSLPRLAHSLPCIFCDTGMPSGVHEKIPRRGGDEQRN